MADDFENPLDDELLKELGLEPRQEEQAEETSEEEFADESQSGAARSTLEEDLFDDIAPQEKPTQVSPPPARPAPQPDQHFAQGVKNISQDMPIQMVAVLGKKTMALKDIVALKSGEIIDLKKLPQDAIDLVANGKLVARGDLVLVDGKLGIQIRQIIGNS